MRIEILRTSLAIILVLSQTAVSECCEPSRDVQQSSGRDSASALLFPASSCAHCGYIAPVTTPAYLFLIVGFVGQLGFSARFIVQWLASERARASVIPQSFWWLSIFGSILLSAYAMSLTAWPILLGQGFNTLIYARNLYLVRRSGLWV